ARASSPRSRHTGRPSRAGPRTGRRRGALAVPPLRRTWPSVAERGRTCQRRRPAGRRRGSACADWIRSGLLVAPGRVRRLIGRALGGVLRRRGGLLARLARLVDGARGLLLGVLALGGRGVLRVLGGVLDPGRRLARGVLGVV